MELFVERARSVQTGFAPSEADHGDLLYICHRLDGLPLALELAAARTQALSVRDIADALSQRFRLLTGGRRSEQRHRSLVEAIRWSFDLLDDDERRFCERLSVCAGGFTVDAAAAVAGLDAVDAAELVARLVERSLVTVTSTAAGNRFGMLESVRHYGLDRLAERDELDAARRAHADHFVRFAAAQDGALGVPGEAGRTLGRMDDELANLRAAHAWLLQAPDPDGLASLHQALYWLALLGIRPEISTWAETALDVVPPDHSRRVDVLSLVSLGRWHRGDVAGSQRALDEWRRLDPPGGRAAAYLASHEGNLVGRAGEFDRAVRLFDECLARADPVQDAMLVAVNRFQRLLYGTLTGETTCVTEAIRWVDEAEAVGNPLVTCWARYAAGEILAGSDPDRAVEHLDVALDLAMTSGCWFVAGVAGVTRASVEARHGDLRQAAIAYRHLLDLWRRGVLRPIESTMLRGVAELLSSAGRPDAAALLHGAVSASVAAPLFGPDAERQAELAGHLAAQIGDEAFAAAAGRGAQLGNDEVLELTAAALDGLA
jgi:tetratricopeptide (TPR) repeat protein